MPKHVAVPDDRGVCVSREQGSGCAFHGRNSRIAFVVAIESRPGFDLESVTDVFQEYDDRMWYELRRNRTLDSDDRIVLRHEACG